MPDYSAPAALLVADYPEAATRATDRVIEAGLRVIRCVTFAEADTALAEIAVPDLLLVDADGIASDRLEPMLASIAAQIGQMGVAVIVAIDNGKIDLAAGLLLGTNAHLLCGADDMEWDRAIREATRPRNMVQEGNRSNDERFRQLAGDAARIAEELKQILAERGLPNPAPGSPARITAAEIRAVIRARRLRATLFKPELFADPAWDMLLDLFAARLEDRQVSVSSLCVAAAVPPTTALRWIKLMEEGGLFERTWDPQDGRRCFIALTSAAVTAMERYIGTVRGAGLTIA